MPSEIQSLADRARSGDPRALARVITAVENRSPESSQLLRALFPHSGRARIIGMTGAPGAGKSTLAGHLGLHRARRESARVAVLAIDPTSPRSHGAILGDRIRMAELYTDRGIFIRSMATRGFMGGIARATNDVVDLLDAAGFELVLVETVGVGQDEVEIIRTVQTNVVVLVPGMGDDIQAIKAGIMEIGDVFAVNKADRPGADRTVTEVTMMMSLVEEHGDWIPPIVKTIASRGEGIAELDDALQRHAGYLQASGELERRNRERARIRIETLLKDKFMQRVPREEYGRIVEAVLRRRNNPRDAAEEILRRLLPGAALSRERSEP